MPHLCHVRPDPVHAVNHGAVRPSQDCAGLVLRCSTPPLLRSPHDTPGSTPSRDTSAAARPRRQRPRQGGPCLAPRCSRPRIFIDAAAAVGAFARPLPLFYAVSQAGRAIAAARSVTQWPVAGHGLAEDRTTADWQTGDILRFQVKPMTKGGVFGAVADVLGVRGLTGTVEVGALWSALPGMNAPNGGTWRLAMGVWPELYAQQRNFTLHLGASHRGFVNLRGQAPSNDARAINDLLADYPAADGASVEAPRRSFGHARPRGEMVFRSDGPRPPSILRPKVRTSGVPLIARDRTRSAVSVPARALACSRRRRRARRIAAAVAVVGAPVRSLANRALRACGLESGSRA